jgi:hypothetical protein
MVLARLSTAGMRVNISKSKFFAEQIEYLGYWITRQGIQPMHNKVEEILNIKVPKTRKSQQTTPVYWYSQQLSRHVVSQKWASNSISNIKLTMHTALIFKEQAKVKDTGQGTRIIEKGLAQPHYSIQHIEGYDLLCHKEKIYIPQSFRQQQRVLSWYHEYLLHPGQTRTEKTIRNTMTWPGLTQDVEHWLFMFHLSSMSNDKEGGA